MLRPLALIAEVTHRCPLACVYCSNPLELTSRSEELDSSIWEKVFREAANLGVIQLHLTGGEPLVRPDIGDLITSANKQGIYTNLITSGIGLSTHRLIELVNKGLDHLQLSIQGATAPVADKIAGIGAHLRKIRIAHEIRTHPIAFTLNAVIHRQNIHELEAIIILAEEIGVNRLEIAHVQYYGWALRNRDALLPTRDQVEWSIEVIHRAKERLRGKLRIDFVLPDYYAKYPKACMSGWGEKSLVVTPNGDVWPCHAAGTLPDMYFDNVKEKSLYQIWYESMAFNKFRGSDWMLEPCRSCDYRTKDYGGCRCQAFAVAGDPNVADPVCHLSVNNNRIVELTTRAERLMPLTIVTQAQPLDWSYRK